MVLVAKKISVDGVIKVEGDEVAPDRSDGI